MTRSLWLLPMAVSLGFLTPSSVAQPKLPKLDDVMGKLKEKRHGGGNQLYKMEFDRTYYTNGQAVRTCRVVKEFQIDWKSGKFRETGWDGCADKPFEMIEVYDGEKIKTQFRDVTADGKPTGDGGWKYGTLSGRPNSWVFQTEYWPVFFHKGVIAGLHDTFYPGHLVFDADVEQFYVHGEAVRAGRKCVSLKTFPEHPVEPMEYEYIIDPGKDYSVIGFVYYQNHKPFYSLSIDVGPARQPGRWAVSGWVYTRFNGQGGAEQTVKVKVTDFAEDVPIGENNKYDIVPPEGAKVGRSHYQLPEGKQDLKIDSYEYEVKNGKLVQVSGPAPPVWDRVRDNWHWFALGAGFVVAAFAGFRVRRGWGRGPHAPPPPTSSE